MVQIGMTCLRYSVPLPSQLITGTRMIHPKTSLLTSLILAIAGIAFVADSAEAQRRFRIGGPFGIGIGGGQGLTIGGGYGVQLGGGQGLRFGPPAFGAQYGGGQGVRYGTPNRGVQFGGGQVLRYGGPNNGIRVGERVRVGNGQLATPIQPNATQFSTTPIPQPIQPSYRQPMRLTRSIQPTYRPQIQNQQIQSQPIQPTYGQPVESSYNQNNSTVLRATDSIILQPTHSATLWATDLSCAGLPATKLPDCECTKYDSEFALHLHTGRNNEHRFVSKSERAANRFAANNFTANPI